MALKKSDLYSSLWASCDELRGGMDASQYKDYVLFMLFIKYISDTHLLSQRGNGTLVLVDVEGKVEPLLTIPEANIRQPHIGCGPEILRDGRGQIYYQVGEEAWLIDVAGRTFEPYRWKAIGDGFENQYPDDEFHGHIIRYRGKTIGQFWFGKARTAPGYIAAEFGELRSKLRGVEGAGTSWVERGMLIPIGFPEEVKVWSAESNTWSTIKPDRPSAIVGWVED